MAHRRWMAAIAATARQGTSFFRLAAGVATLATMLAGCSIPKSLPQLREDGAAALERHEYEEAREAYAQVLERKPEDADANHGMGRILLATGDPLRARRHLSVAYHQVPHNPDLSFDIGRDLAEAMAQSGDIQGMVVFLSDAARTRGQTRDYLLWGDLAAKYGDPDSAEIAYRTAIGTQETPTVEPYLKIAEFYESVGKIDVATQRLRQAYSIDPEHPEVLAKLQTYYAVVGPSLALPPEK